MQVIIYILVLFGGYAVGRVGHMLGGHLKTLHHWIYGITALIIGSIFSYKFWGEDLALFGIGFIVSDLKDMLSLKFYGIDDVKIKRFWGID